ncbi:MAG: acyltransferase [Bryobacteraceae bacterium]|nr:acyltransferase [Bryobacteraceae bacterium]
MSVFRRIVTTGKYLPEVDGLRFLAIASVVLYHFQGFHPQPGLTEVSAHGYRGVNLFYVISGFILGLPFAAHHLDGKPTVSLRSYFIRRLTRLEVPYLLNLLICFALLVLAYHRDAAELWPHLFASMLYLHNLVYGEQSSINPVAWTLEVEVQFYCLAPALASVFKIRDITARRALLIAAIVAISAVQLYFWDAPPRLRLSLVWAIQFFLTGLLLADVYLTSKPEVSESSWLWDLVAAVNVPLILLPTDRPLWFALPFLLLATAYSAFHGTIFRSLLRSPFIATTGGMCYSIYLIHYILIPVIPNPAVYVAVMLAVSAAYFLVVERPCMVRDWPRKLFH